MWEFFWFILGALVYKFLCFALQYNNKAKFIQEIRIVAFQLIGRALEELLLVQAMRYKLLFKKQEKDVKEKIKAYNNESDAFIGAWKIRAVEVLNSSVPPHYKSDLEAADWGQLVELLDTYYKQGVKQIKNDSES
mgnify:CR=1 FL=1|tara:strand:- start:8095 stop:8499 length:405 start_codon:yes stop_codon:yes gene_type:complete